MPRLSLAALGLSALVGTAFFGFARPEAIAAPGAPALTSTQPRKAGWAELRYAIVDADRGMWIPGKLTFVGVNGTRTPRLGPRAGKRDGEVRFRDADGNGRYDQRKPHGRH